MYRTTANDMVRFVIGYELIMNGSHQSVVHKHGVRRTVVVRLTSLMFTQSVVGCKGNEIIWFDVAFVC